MALWDEWVKASLSILIFCPLGTNGLSHKVLALGNSEIIYFLKKLNHGMGQIRNYIVNFGFFTRSGLMG